MNKNTGNNTGKNTGKITTAVTVNKASNIFRKTLNPQTEPQSVTRNIILFILYFIILLVVGVSFDRIAKNKTGVSREIFTYAFTGIFISISILIFIFGYKTNNDLDINIFNQNILLNLNYRIGLLVISIFIFIALIYFFNIVSYLFIGIFILIVIVGLAIIFNVLYNVFEKSIRNTEIKLIIELIFFIPCLFNDILKWGLDQINMTPYLTYILLFIEIILILAYLYLPELFNTILNGTIVGKNGKVLQKEPFYINKGNSAVIATSADLLINQKKLTDISSSNFNEINLFDKSIFSQHNKDYSLSMWININPQSISSSTEIDILSYFYTGTVNGTKHDYYKPKIVYTSSSNLSSPSVKDVYKIYFTGGKNDLTSIIEIHVPNQRWNHFVFNYVNGKMAELWVNGVMERVMKFTGDIPVPQYDASDQIVIGSLKESGTNGAICNVIYFDKSISSYQIVNMYNYGMLGLQSSNSYPQ